MAVITALTVEMEASYGPHPPCPSILKQYAIFQRLNYYHYTSLSKSVFVNFFTVNGDSIEFVPIFPLGF